MEQLYPFLLWDVTFWEKSMFATIEMIEMERKIHEILFPTIQYEYIDYCRATTTTITVGNEIDKKWLNSRCDSIVLWSHIYYSGDIFITRDNNFHKQSKKKKLLELGAKNILTPEEVISLNLNLK